MNHYDFLFVRLDAAWIPIFKISFGTYTRARVDAESYRLKERCRILRHPALLKFAVARRILR